ncbi:hypothetical protein V8N76_004521 [Salmonella enterica]
MSGIQDAVARGIAEIEARERGERPVLTRRERQYLRLEARRQARLTQLVAITAFYPSPRLPDVHWPETPFDPYGPLNERNGGKYRGD